VLPSRTFAFDTLARLQVIVVVLIASTYEAVFGSFLAMKDNRGPSFRAAVFVFDIFGIPADIMGKSIHRAMGMGYA
jgi:hypothetical protein